jgi:hypothetical protein
VLIGARCAAEVTDAIRLRALDIPGGLRPAFAAVTLTRKNRRAG